MCLVGALKDPQEMPAGLISWLETGPTSFRVLSEIQEKDRLVFQTKKNGSALPKFSKTERDGLSNLNTADPKLYRFRRTTSE